MAVRDPTPILIVPGLGGSGPGHWQTLWQADIPGACRVEQADWDEPRRDQWIDALRSAVTAAPGAIVVAHSLGCILLAHLLAEHPDAAVSAALLVAPADVERPSPASECVRRFAPIPLRPLAFPSTVVASSNDPFASFERAESFARAWGSELVGIGAAGHINVDSGFGPWPEGRAMLDRLIVRIDGRA
jgi:predicted alpha/beta hydrolase family esterase